MTEILRERGWRTAALATGSGLALLAAVPATVAAPGSPTAAIPAAAVPGSGPVVEGALVGAEVVSASAVPALVSPAVVVRTDASWEIGTTPVEGEKPPPPPPPPPPPEPEPEPVVRVASAPRVVRTQAPPPSVSGNAVLQIAYRYLGVPYVYGGTTPSGFDCSGFTQYVYAQLGVSLPRTSSAQRYAGTVVSAAAARPGDLMWYPGHIGIYIGGGDYIGARMPGVPLMAGPITHPSPVFIRVT